MDTTENFPRSGRNHDRDPLVCDKASRHQKLSRRLLNPRHSILGTQKIMDNKLAYLHEEDCLGRGGLKILVQTCWVDRPKMECGDRGDVTQIGPGKSTIVVTLETRKATESPRIADDRAKMEPFSRCILPGDDGKFQSQDVKDGRWKGGG